MLRAAIEVMVIGYAHGLQALHEPARHFVDVAGIGDEQRPFAAVQVVEQPVVSLHAAEMRQHTVPTARQRLSRQALGVVAVGAAF